LHVVQRGNNRTNCFSTDADRLVFLSMLRDQALSYTCSVHAYCLMTNHVHLLLTPGCEAGPSLLMREVTRCYSSYFNRRQGRAGTLWQGPFRSCLVDSTAYVLACHRYIELNPVRAGIVESPAEYPWSSHLANIGQARDPLVVRHPEHEALSLQAYLALFAGDDAEFLTDVREATARGYPLVGEALKAKLEEQGVRTAPGKPGRASAPSKGPRTCAVREPDDRITYPVRN
jgi:putative transposase